MISRRLVKTRYLCLGPFLPKMTIEMTETKKRKRSLCKKISSQWKRSEDIPRSLEICTLTNRTARKSCKPLMIKFSGRSKTSFKNKIEKWIGANSTGAIFCSLLQLRMKCELKNWLWNMTHVCVNYLGTTERYNVRQNPITFTSRKDVERR